MTYEVAISIGISVVAILFMYLAVKFNPKQYYFQVLFMIIGLVVATVLIEILRQIAVNNSETDIANILGGVYAGFMWVTVIVVFIHLVIFFYSGIMMLIKRNKKSKGERVD